LKARKFTEDAEDLYQNAPFGYLTMQKDGMIVNINSTLLSWLGYSREDVLLQKSFPDFLGMGEKIYFETHIMPMLVMEDEVSEINIMLRGRESIMFPALLNGKRIRKKQGNEPLFRFSVLNITQRKMYELELMKARNKAEQTVQRLKQVNEELEQFAYIASHDLQAPLSTISGLINLLEKKGHFPPGSKEREYLSMIKSNADRMKLMISDLLEYAKIDGKETRFREVSLNEICSHALNMIKDQVKKHNATFRIPALPVVTGDAIQLVRLFLNLFGNAIKYRSDADPLIEVEYGENEGSVTVFVHDNGIGFNQEFAGQIFGFMKRLHSHESIPGTGIGLSACKRIVEIHGGTIGAVSETGKGSTFHFTLPKRTEHTSTQMPS
jgi:PAS domain S-box-containing protein